MSNPDIMSVAKPSVAEPRCIVCFDVNNNGLSCSQGHTTCDTCYDAYINEQAEALENTNLLAIKADSAEQIGDSRMAEFFSGASLCPLKGHGCTAAPFDARAVAMHASAAAFHRHIQAKTLLPAARRVQEIVRKRAELSSMLPNARMCGRCSFGPIELVGCDDLTTHHGQVMSGSSVPIDNSCRRCGWFEPHISRWPVWHPTGLEADEDPLDAAFAQQAEAETEEAAAVRRAARVDTIRLFREERAQREEIARQRRMEAAAERRREREIRLRRRGEWEQDADGGWRHLAQPAGVGAAPPGGEDIHYRALDARVVPPFLGPAGIQQVGDHLFEEMVDEIMDDVGDDDEMPFRNKRGEPVRSVPNPEVEQVGEL